MSDVLDRLIKLAAKKYEVDPSTIKPEADVFQTLGIDSFAVAELMSELEYEFDVEIPDYELQGVNTFGEFAKVIDKRR